LGAPQGFYAIYQSGLKPATHDRIGEEKRKNHRGHGEEGKNNRVV
jgi:hypothetical protein